MTWLKKQYAYLALSLVVTVLTWVTAQQASHQITLPTAALGIVTMALLVSEKLLGLFSPSVSDAVSRAHVRLLDSRVDTPLPPVKGGGGGSSPPSTPIAAAMAQLKLRWILGLAACWMLALAVMGCKDANFPSDLQAIENCVYAEVVTDHVTDALAVVTVCAPQEGALVLDFVQSLIDGGKVTDPDQLVKLKATMAMHAVNRHSRGYMDGLLFVPSRL
jgi:hypothetical protein